MPVYNGPAAIWERVEYEVTLLMVSELTRSGYISYVSRDQLRFPVTERLDDFLKKFIRRPRRIRQFQLFKRVRAIRPGGVNELYTFA